MKRYLVTVLEKQYYDIEVEAETEQEAINWVYGLSDETLKTFEAGSDVEVFVDSYMQYKLERRNDHVPDA